MGTLRELLTKPDTIRITTPVLPRETLERVLEIIRRDVAADNVKIDNPTQNLESYFLEVVQRARQAAAATSGATSGHRIAEYLRGEAEAKPAADRILERFTLPSAAPKAPVVESPPAPAIDAKKLEALTKAETAPAASQPAHVPQEKPVDLSKADEKLAALLGKKSTMDKDSEKKSR